MKKILSLVLAVVMVLGLSVTAFAAEDPYTGNTTITANVAAPELEYVIIIPDAVTMNEAGVKEIGAASIDTAEGKLKNATAKTVISYTASGTDFKLKTDTSKTMSATYYSAYTNADNNTVLDSAKAIEVYKNSALVDPLTKLYVGVAQTDWDNAAQNNPGTYTATVTYNFSAEEKAAEVTVASILPDDFGSWSNGGMGTMRKSDTELYVDGPETAFMSLTNKLTPTGDGNYTATSNGDDTWTFIMDGSKCNKIVISNNRSMVNGEYTAR